MYQSMCTSGIDSQNPVEPTNAPPASENTHLQGGHATRRAMMAGAAMLSALSLPAVAEGNPDAGVVELAHRLLAGIEAEYRLRLALEAAWAASERIRHQLLAADPHRDGFGKSNGGPLLRAAVAMLGEKLPAHLTEDIQGAADVA
jgi:hypothetical protein